MRFNYYFFILISILFSGKAYCQGNTTHNTQEVNSQGVEISSKEKEIILDKMTDQRIDFSAPISADSLQKIYKVIDVLEYFNLKRLEEAYTYRSRVAPNESNKAIFRYIKLAIETKFKSLND